MGTAEGDVYRFGGRRGTPAGQIRLSGAVVDIGVLQDADRAVAFVAAARRWLRYHFERRVRACSTAEVDAVGERHSFVFLVVENMQGFCFQNADRERWRAPWSLMRGL